MTGCVVTGCEGGHWSRGCCYRHYKQLWRKARRGIPVTPETVEVPVSKLPGWLDLDRLARVVPRRGWERNGACFENRETAAFYPERGEWSDATVEPCRACPARYACLASAIARADHDDHGVWGGTSVRDRRRIRKALAAREVAA